MLQLAKNELFFQHACRGMDMRIIHVAASQFLVPNQIVLRKNLRCKEELGELSPCSKLSKQWIASLRKWPVPQFWLTKLVTKLLTKWPVRQFLRNIFSNSTLVRSKTAGACVITVEAYFYGMVATKKQPDFGKFEQLEENLCTTQGEFSVWCF